MSNKQLPAETLEKLQDCAAALRSALIRMEAACEYARASLKKMDRVLKWRDRGRKK